MKKMKLCMKAGLLLLATAAASCTQEEGAMYDAKTNEAYFEKAAATYAFGADDPTSTTITLKRFISGGAVSVPIKVTAEASSLFTLPATADFADGKLETTITVTFSREALTTGEPYLITIDVPEHQNLIPGYNISTKLTIMRDYVWSPSLSASLNSAWFVEDNLPVEVYKADLSGGEALYRVVEPYGDYDLLIRVNGTTATVVKQQVDLSNGVAPITVEGGGTFSGNVLTLTLDFILWYPVGVEYYSEMGNEEVITLSAN
jgi:hypothetical protein